MSLELPTGESVTWYTYSSGGRDLAQKIDEHARVVGLGLADWRALSGRHEAVDYTNGPLHVTVWHLAAVFEDILAGRCASPEDPGPGQGLHAGPPSNLARLPRQHRRVNRPADEHRLREVGPKGLQMNYPSFYGS
ncbi:hypothetical protein [Kitasatospora sp. NPDC098663]|uniref:hypothetical protein n=1 Tax=Kitasatospora sp. NPDC098663 TaxID=3364096 RepID=UPI003828CD0A